MRPKFGLAAAAVAGALGLVASPATAAPGGAERPATGFGSGTITYTFGTPPIHATEEGTAYLSHLGKSTYSLTNTITFTSATAFTVAGAETIVAANGDMLFATFTGNGELDGPFGVGQTSETTAVVTITGGTGRFANASGTLTSIVSSIVTSITGNVGTSSQTFAVSGAISY
jgi:hypothetical protein